MTPTQQRTNYLNWMSLEGTTLGATYLLGQCLGADERKVTFKARARGEEQGTAVARIFRDEADRGGEQIAVWKELRELKHPNLLAILGAGRATLQGQPLIFVVTEAAEETLDGVLRERALDPAEAGEMLLSCCRGLEELHKAGFVHGSVAPEQVVSVGDAVKLATEGVRKAVASQEVAAGPREGAPPEVDAIEVSEAKYRAPESKNGNVTAEGDVWCLGATLFEALTQRDYAGEARNEASKLQTPFNTIAERCLDYNPETRAKLSEVTELYETPQLAVGASAGAGAGASVGARAAVMEPLQENPIVGPSPVVEIGRDFIFREPEAETEKPRIYGSVPYAKTTEAKASRPIYFENRRRPRRQIWVYLALGLVVVAALIWLAGSRRANRGTAGRAPVAPSATSATTSPTTTTNRQASATPGQAASNTQVRSGAMSASHQPVTRAGTSNPTVTSARPVTRARARGAEANDRNAPVYINGPVWRVVIYTYHGAADAQKRAQAINEKHPGLKAEVFSPNGTAGPFLVVVGGQMNRDQAVSMRQQALRSGLPHDSYIQNYKE